MPERWLIAVGLNLVIWPAVIAWRRWQKGGRIQVRHPAIRLIPAAMSTSGVALAASVAIYAHML